MLNFSLFCTFILLLFIIIQKSLPTKHRPSHNVPVQNSFGAASKCYSWLGKWYETPYFFIVCQRTKPIHRKQVKAHRLRRQRRLGDYVLLPNLLLKNKRRVLKIFQLIGFSNYLIDIYAGVGFKLACPGEKLESFF